MNNKHDLQIGMTLVETLVAITIFLMISTATTSVLHRSLQAQRYAAEQTTATYLAIEGIEAIRQYRDTARLRGLSGIDLFPKPCFFNDGPGGQGCNFSAGDDLTIPGSYQDLGEAEDANLYLTSDGYVRNSGTATPYSRSVFIKKQDFDGKETYLVTSTVFFKIPGSVNSKVELTEIMYNLPDFNN